MKCGLTSVVKESCLWILNGYGMLVAPQRPPILVYHSVDPSGSCISIAPSLFRRQMQRIRDLGYRTTTVSELVAALRQGKRMPRRSVVLTFDDGFESNYFVAFPVLKDLGLTATIFLTTDYLGKRCTWDKEDDIPDLPLLSWDMVREMSRSGMDFQSHTATHPHLPRLSEDQIRQELRRSRHAIEESLGKPGNILCYPYAEFDDRVVRILREEGFLAGLAGWPRREHIFAIRRIGSGHCSVSVAAFQAALRGTFPAYYLLKIGVRRMLKRRGNAVAEG